MIVKLAVVCVVTVLIALKLKQINPVYSTVLSMGLCIFVLFFAIDRIKIVVDLINNLSDIISIDGIYISILLKIMGVSYICEFASSLCKDAGYQAVSSQIEVVGKLSMLVISIPVIYAVIDTIKILLT